MLIAAMALLAVGGMQAQVILDEGFETGNTGSALTPVAAGAGWTVVNGYKGENAQYNWYNYYSNAESETGATITGNCCAAVDAPYYYTETGDGYGPREEVLLSPELNLNDDYELQFTFRVSPMNSSEKSRYDIQVRVVEDDNLAGAETIFSIQNEKMMREAGIGVYPISDWNPYTAKVHLGDFKGEKVKLAFVYKMYGETANVVWLDDILVKKAAPITGPIASLSMSRYDFGQLYIGQKRYSDVITLTNTGKDGLTITSVDLPEGLSLNIDPTHVDLKRYQHVDFQLCYEASLKSPKSGDVVLHTSGGDVKISFSATKQFVPDDCTLETFEGYFPPAGWTNRGWDWTVNAIEGDHSVVAGGGFGAAYLTSPRLDLLDGGSVTFTYFNQYEDENYPEYDIELQVSYDGGQTWTTKWVSDYENGLNQLLTETVDLGTGSDNSYIRWYYPTVETDDEGAYPHSTFFLDSVVLPYLYGQDGVPGQVSNIAPATGATNVYPQNVKLEWTPAQFAEGYKLYVGTDKAATDLINGEDLGNKLSYVLPDLGYSTAYRWKVVPYNAAGDCATISTWTFTTQADASVSTYPYEENFTDNGGELPIGWISNGSEHYNRQWFVNTLKPYINDDKQYGAASTIWLTAGDTNDMVTAPFILPEGEAMEISFLWGDEHPASLTVDPSNSVKKQNVDPDNGASILYFDVLSDGKWQNLSLLSENYYDGEHKYWVPERIDLTSYRGKKVQFRWRSVSLSGKHNGGAVTHVVVEKVEGQKAFFNKSAWNAGKVNYEKAVASGDLLTISNSGTEEAVVKEATFNTNNFTTSLAEGDKIPVDGTLPFSITFSALDTNAEVTDALTVEFESGYVVTLPVSGVALPQYTDYFSFEPNDLDLKWDEYFTMIDADKLPNFNFGSYWVHYTAGGMKGAFSVESDSKEDGLYGMIKPVSGMYALVGGAPTSGSADNWIISKQVRLSDDSKLEFYGRNLETLNSVLPDPKHHVEVLVSTAGNTDTKDFKTVMRDTEMPFLGEGEWNHYEVSLADYAGKKAYVALRHTTSGPSNVAFFDDVTLHNVDKEQTGIETVSAIGDNDEVVVYNYAGVKVAEGRGAAALNGLARGLYVVRIGDKAIRVRV